MAQPFNPNFLPEYQIPDQIDLSLSSYAEQIERNEQSVYFFGSSFSTVLQEDFAKEKQKYYDMVLTPWEKEEERMRSVIADDEMSFDRTDEPRFYEKFYRTLSQSDENEAGGFVSLWWDIDSLASNPYQALLSWQKAFQRFNNDKSIPEETQRAFIYTSLVMLSCFTTMPRSNLSSPVEYADILFESYSSYDSASNNLWTAYSPLHSEIQNERGIASPYNKSKSGQYTLATEDGEIVQDVYSKQTGKLIDSIRKVFADHFEKAGISISNLSTVECSFNDAIERGVSYAERNTNYAFLLPYICTKVFGNVLYASEYDRIRIINTEWLNIGKYDRLFDNHKYLFEEPKYPSDSSKNPVIAFMQDVVHVVFDYDAEVQKTSYSNLRLKMNTNWLSLYYYGRNRFFKSKTICSEFTGLTMPSLLRKLLTYQKDNSYPTVDYSWIMSRNSGFDQWCDVKSVPEIEKYIISEELLFAKDKTGLLIDPFCESLWEKGSFVPRRKGQFEVSKEVNEIITNFANLLQQKGIEIDPTIPVRVNIIQRLLAPIENDLFDFIHYLDL